jgi:iron(III) transport system ATP-binding protein
MSPVKPTPFVVAQKLTKKFGDFVALRDVSLAIEQGNTLALLGESGCGKTTMLRCIAGLEEPTVGRIAIAGQTVFDSGAGINLAPEHRQLGVVFQSYAVWPHMTVGENVGFPLKVRGVRPDDLRSRVKAILAMVGLGDRIDHSASQLSGGQQQRVALARALIHEPRLVLFDEALSNLDAQLREQMRMELRLLQLKLGFTAVYVTHDQAEAFGLAERVIVMNKGRIEAEGSPRDLFWNPPTAFVAKFLGLNLLGGTVTELNDKLPGRPAAPGGYARVQLASGSFLWGRIGSHESISIGDDVVSCIRKEHVAIRPAGQAGGSSDGAAHLNGTITASSFVGLADEYVINMQGFDLRSVQSIATMAAGTAVEIEIQPDECIVLPRPKVEEAAAG